MVGYAWPGGLLGHLSRNWWLVVLRGVAAILFGLLALLWPGLTLVALAVVFGVYALLDAGVIGYAASRAERGTRAPLVVQAVLALAIGLAALLWPLAAVIALVFVVGAWAIVIGLGEIVTALRLRAQISSEWLLIFIGSLSVIFGLLLWFWPLESAQALVFVVGVYAVVFGAVLTVAGFRLRKADGLFDEKEGEDWAGGWRPEYGGDLLGRHGSGEAPPTEEFDPGERFERPRRPGDEAPESPGATRAFHPGGPEEDSEDTGPPEPPEPGDRRRPGRHRAPKHDD